MKNYWYFIAIISLIILSVVILIQRDSKSDLPLSETSNEVPLKIWVQTSFLGEEAYYEDLSLHFKKMYPDITLELSVISGNDDQVYNYITENILNGHIPDILLLSLKNYNAMATENRLYSLNAYLETYENDYFLASTINNSYYNKQSYGIAYKLDPEILLYKYKVNGTPIEGFKNTEELLSQLLAYTPESGVLSFSIPSLTSEGRFIQSLLSGSLFPYDATHAFESIGPLLRQFKPGNFDYSKLSTHTFFEDESVIGLEPLSLLYKEIKDDYSIKDKIGIVPIGENGPYFSYSLSHYTTIYRQSIHIDECILFMDLFFSQAEIYNRYFFYDLPIICSPLKDSFLNDKRFDNRDLWPYIENAFHNPIQLSAEENTKLVDYLYEELIFNAAQSETDGDKDE